MDGFKAIVIVDRSSNYGMRLRDTLQRRNAVAYVFKKYAPALAFMRATKVDTVVVEFDVEVETLDFCDAAKALKIPILFSAKALQPDELTEYGVREADVIYPERTDPAVWKRAS